MSVKPKKIFIGADHAAVKRKAVVKELLKDLGYSVEDVGSFDEQSADDFPIYAKAVAKKVAARPNTRRGILLCGSGTGMMIAANKVNGIRAALAYDLYSARKSREDNDANVLTLRAREFPEQLTKDIVKTWLSTPFSNESRHRRRIRAIAKIEQNH